MAKQNELSPAAMQQYFIKWKDGRLSPSEHERLQKWLAVSPENAQEWSRLNEIWHWAKPPAVPTGQSTDAHWEKLARRLSSPHLATPRAEKTFLSALVQKFFALAKPMPRWAFAVVAFFFILALVKFSVTYFNENWQTLTVPYGQRAAIQLSDGSVVELNAGSTFKYPQKFRSAVRQVELAGEAFFQVRPGQAPFKVETEQAITEVLGTAFNIRTWEQATQVFVQSGKVTLRAKSSTTGTMVISTGQMALCDKTPILLAMIKNPDDILAWRQNRLVFRDRALAEVLLELERHFNTHLEADANLLRHTITASFAQEPLAEVIASLAASLNARYETTREGYRLHSE